MANVVTAAPVQTVNVNGANLYQLAAQYLLDATQWYRIAQLNGLSDPFVVGPLTLKIPPIGPSNGGVMGSS